MAKISDYLSPWSVERRGKRIWVLFLFDTGSPHTFLRKETWKALGYSGQVDIPTSVNVDINGIPTAVSMSRGHFENVDLLGQNYLDKAGLRVEIDYKTRDVKFAREH